MFRKSVIKPKKLRRGGTVALIAPSCWCADRVDATRDYVAARGFNVVIHPQSKLRDYARAGTPDQKVAALHDVFADKKIDAVLCLRGGHGALQMLDQIDYSLIRRNPKIMLGYSDVTALHGAIGARTGLVTFHGPLIDSAGNPDEMTSDDARHSMDDALEFLCGNSGTDILAGGAAQVLRAGIATGRLVGGNFSVLSALIAAGHDFIPRLGGAILVVEEVDEDIYKIDQMFAALRLGGVLRQLGGLVVGGMTDLVDRAGDWGAGPFGHDVRAIVEQNTRGLDMPIIMDAPFGHDAVNRTFPLGVRARLVARENGSVTLDLTESPFADG